jgi:hypothetical protein
VAKTPKKQSARKPATKRATPTKSQAVPKPKFDTEAFVFDTPIEKIEEALQRLEEQEADPMAEPLTQDQLYWWIVWTTIMPDAKRRGMTTVPICAKESAVLGLYEKPKGRKKK